VHPTRQLCGWCGRECQLNTQATQHQPALGEAHRNSYGWLGQNVLRNPNAWTPAVHSCYDMLHCQFTATECCHDYDVALSLSSPCLNPVQLTYQEALAAVFIEGWIFIFISLTGVRGRLVSLVPKSIMLATAGGIGLFLAL